MADEKYYISKKIPPDNLIEKALRSYSVDFELISTRKEAKAFRDNLDLKSEIVLEDFSN